MYLVADAYRGTEIPQTVLDFLDAGPGEEGGLESASRYQEHERMQFIVTQCSGLALVSIILLKR